MKNLVLLLLLSVPCQAMEITLHGHMHHVEGRPAMKYGILENAEAYFTIHFDDCWVDPFLWTRCGLLEEYQPEVCHSYEMDANITGRIMADDGGWWQWQYVPAIWEDPYSRLTVGEYTVIVINTIMSSTIRFPGMYQLDAYDNMGHLVERDVEWQLSPIRLDIGTSSGSFGEPDRYWPSGERLIDLPTMTNLPQYLVSALYMDWDKPPTYCLGCMTRFDLDAITVVQDTLSPGDANGDGVFNQMDIVEVMQAGTYMTGGIAAWSEGDWNADGVFNQFDIVQAMMAGEYAVNNAAVMTVPEPTTKTMIGGALILVLFFVTGFALGRNRR